MIMKLTINDNVGVFEDSTFKLLGRLTGWGVIRGKSGLLEKVGLIQLPNKLLSNHDGQEIETDILSIPAYLLHKYP